MTGNVTATAQTRPYRSHKVPACSRCRSRKIRCNIDIPGEPCLSCRERRLKCQYVDTPAPTTSNGENGECRPVKRRRDGDSSRHGATPSRPHSAPVLHKPSNTPSASIILAPHVAEDVDIVKRHISQHRPVGREGSEPSYHTLSHDISSPVVYLSVPRFRTGLRSELGAGKKQLEIIEQIMGPFKQEVIGLYFSHIHPYFPILDAETCALVKENPKERDEVSKNLLSTIYASGSPHWRKSDTLKLHARPDLHFLWSKAASALLEDFLSPSMATVTASVLDQIGRPSVSMVGNITLCGRTISLAQTFGLHRDPSEWKITDAEKSARLRLWWGVLITDYWSSISYGTPPQIVKDFYDVPRPTIESLTMAKATKSEKYASTCFIHLCALTELLGDILPLVYQARPNPESLTQSVECLKTTLDELEAQLPEWLPLPDRNGTSNLWFCFLSMRLLLSRVGLRAAVLAGDSSSKSTRLDELREASTAVVEFIMFLGENQFQDFWLPFATHLLLHAVTVSLRCAIEAQDDVRRASVSRLELFITHIQFAHDNYDWDIAHFCLERCAGAVATISALATRSTESAEPLLSMNGADISTGLAFDDTSFLVPDMLDINNFDFSWEALWDTPSIMTNFSI
ncbi:C6 transcription factor-like protein [Massariosphaeria phaeospora]|uniref:C6 transcription factor-like protein n=1 Tax=Massariosphaeria phaeospora TaxID=100035 RepID=A0A7C8MTM8_9PLEO|nr:C6 transcription factor-like protein [Massariosphaeria phaeospora]